MNYILTVRSHLVCYLQNHLKWTLTERFASGVSDQHAFPDFRELDAKLVPDAIIAVRGADTNDTAAAFSARSIEISSRSGREKFVQIGSHISACRAKVHEKLAVKTVSELTPLVVSEVRTVDLSELSQQFFFSYLPHQVEAFFAYVKEPALLNALAIMKSRSMEGEMGGGFGRS